MKTTFIRLKAAKGIAFYYINLSHINAMYRDTKEPMTWVLVPAHNNGGFTVVETPEEILNLINNS